MKTRRAASGVLLVTSLGFTACERPTQPAAARVDAGLVDASGKARPGVAVSLGSEPTKEEQRDMGCQVATRLVGKTIAPPRSGFSSFFPFGEDLIFRDGDRVVRRSEADGSNQVLLEVPGLVSIRRQGDEVVLFVRDAGGAWIERRPVDKPATIDAHRAVVTKVTGGTQLDEGWCSLDEVHWISDDEGRDAPHAKWGSTIELAHVDFAKSRHVSLPDSRMGGTFVGFYPTAQHLFWWERKADPFADGDIAYSDFLVRSMTPDGRVAIHRKIEGFVTALAVDEPPGGEARVAWMDASEGPCESDNGRHGVVWIAPLAGGARKRVMGGQVCARAMTVVGDDIFWATESHALWWANVRTGQHLLVAGGCDAAWAWPTERGVYISRRGAEAGARELLRVAWWR